jgi:hypothetical protein
MMACLGLILMLAGQPWSEEAAASQVRAFQAAQWATTTHLADVATPVLTQLHARLATRIADHGGAFNPTDVQVGEDVPRVRLVLAGHSGNRWFVCLEVGGVALGNVKHSDTPEGWAIEVAELKSAFREKRLAPVDPTPYLLKE